MEKEEQWRWKRRKGRRNNGGREGTMKVEKEKWRRRSNGGGEGEKEQSKGARRIHRRCEEERRKLKWVSNFPEK